MAASDPSPYVATPTGVLQGVAAFSWDGSVWQPSGRAGPAVATPTGVLQGVAAFNGGPTWQPAGRAQPGVATPTGVLDGVAVYTWSGSAWTPAYGGPSCATPSGVLRGVAGFNWDGAAWQPAAQARPSVATPYGVLDGVAMFSWTGSAWAAVGAPSLSLDFMSPGVLPPNVSFTRATTATYFDSTGTMQTAATNAPRFDYDPVTHALRGLLIEEQRTNTVLNSGNAANASWGPSGITVAAPAVTANQVVAPDGTTTAARVVYPAVPGAGNASYLMPTSGGMTVAPYSFSVWLRGNVGGEQLYLCATPDGATYFRQAVTLTTSWQRFTLVTGNLSTAGWFFILGTDRRDASQAATGAQTVFVWGAQVEQGAFPTSYIPTVAATVTRGADISYIATAAQPWFNAGTMTMAVEAYYPVVNGVSIGFGDNITFANSWYLGGGGASGAIRASGGTATSSSLVVGAVNKSASSQTTTAIRCCVNAGAVGSTAQSVSALTVDRLAFGSSPWSLDGTLDGHIRRVRCWTRILSDAEMQSVTT